MGRWKLPRACALVGGAAVPEVLIRAFDRHGIWIMQGWGMTETSPIATISYPAPNCAGATDDERYRRAAMAGTGAAGGPARATDDGHDRPGTARPWARSRCAARSSPAATTRCR
jgi:fatty-acyl-CoA synthase